ADRVSGKLRRRARWRAAGVAGPVGGRIVAPRAGVLPTAQRILRHRERLPAAGVDGSGTHPIVRTTALSGAGRVGQTAGVGSHPGSADPAGQVEAAVPWDEPCDGTPNVPRNGLPGKTTRTCIATATATCACITETRRLCRATTWPANGCVCGPRPTIGSTPWTASPSLREQRSGPRADRH